MTNALIPHDWPGTSLFGDDEVDAVTAVIASKSPFRYYGPQLVGATGQLEDAFRTRLGRRHALAVNSGTMALSVAMSALDIGPGDEVLVPGFFWVSCAAAIVRSGAVPRLVEVDDTLTIDVADLVTKVNERTKAVLVVHMSGAPADVEAILSVAADHDVAVIEDCAQSNGGSLHGRPLGSFGDIAIFSFQMNKHITAGEGGMVVCDDDTLARRAFAAHDNGSPRDSSGVVDSTTAADHCWGLGGRMSELTASVLVAQEHKLDDLVAAMRSIRSRLAGELDGLGGCRVRPSHDDAGDAALYLILIWPDKQAGRHAIKSTRDAGVLTPTGSGNIPLDRYGQHVYSNVPSLVHKIGTNSSDWPWSDPRNAFATSISYERGSLPRTDELLGRSQLLSICPEKTDESIQAIIDAFEGASRATTAEH